MLKKFVKNMKKRCFFMFFGVSDLRNDPFFGFLVHVFLAFLHVFDIFYKEFHGYSHFLNIFCGSVF